MPATFDEFHRPLGLDDDLFHRPVDQGRGFKEVSDARDSVAATGLSSTVAGDIDSETRLLAAIAYGEGSTADVEDELSGIAHAVANRAKAWGGKKVSEVVRDDPNYTYAANGKNERFNLLKASSLENINKSKGMRIAINAAREALAGKGSDPSNGAYWWDGIDLKDKKPFNPRIQQGFTYGAPEHNIFDMTEISKPVITYWQVKNSKTGKLENSKERGRYDCVYRSTAAHGKTIFWRYTADYVKATGAKEYK
jgi:hypothetical protein